MYVVIDFETTGFDPATCDIIEFAYAAFEDNGIFIKAERLYFYHKGMSWSEEAYNVHQIPLSFLEKHEDEFKTNLIKMYSILNNNTVVGFNCKHFDCPFAVTWLARQGIYGLSFHRIKDVMLSYKPITKRSRIKLTKLTEMMNIDPNTVRVFTERWFGGDEVGLRSHEASYDVTITALLTFMAVNKKLMTFAYADTNTSAVTINVDDEFGQSADVEQKKVYCVDITYVSANGTLDTFSIPIGGLSSNVELSTQFTHVGTATSTIYACKGSDGTPVTLDTSTGLLRICGSEITEVKTADTVSKLLAIIS